MIGGELTPEQVESGAEFARSQHRVPYAWPAGPFDSTSSQSAALNAALNGDDESDDR